MPISSIRKDAEAIYQSAIRQSLPDRAVRQYLEKLSFSKGRVVVVAVGKAAWTMANTAAGLLGERISSGVVITKYRHSRGPIPRLAVIEAGHPLPDGNSFAGARRAIDCVSGLSEEDTVLFLLSGGGSALFELSPLPLEELRDINQQLLSCGASIQEINTIRKRLSRIKGGRFAQLCAPARIVSLVLSDVVDNRLDMIASGPTCADPSTCEEAAAIARKYRLRLSPRARAYMMQETPKAVSNGEYYICGSVRQLCRAACLECERLGYETVILTDCLCGTARGAGEFLASIARYHSGQGKRAAFIAGGETVVHLTGQGKGGRNQELALAAAEGISGLEGAVIFSVGSDGTDGPTDAAGGIVDGETQAKLAAQGIKISDILRENDAYHALEHCGGLIKTGATGTNVNDLSVVLIDG